MIFAAASAVACANATIAMHQQQLAAMQSTTGMQDLWLGPKLPAKPCRYCGRTEQTWKHRSCDGCGAPKETNS